MVSILLATFNGEKYLKNLLDSLERQTFHEWELIVLDDCSEDLTWEILNSYKLTTKHKTQLYRNSCRKGSGKDNFFELMKICDSEYVMFCDQDDVWCSDKIEIELGALCKLEHQYGKNIPLLVHSDMVVVDEKLSVIDNSYYHYARYKKNGDLQLHLCINRIPGCSLIFNHCTLKFCKRSLESNKIIMHDSWVALIAYAMGKVEFIDKGLTLYRQHQNNSLGAANANNIRYKIMRILNRNNMKMENREHIVQASYFFEQYCNDILDSRIKKLLMDYSKLADQSLAAYIFICLKYKIFKYPISRAVFQLISGC